MCDKKGEIVVLTYDLDTTCDKNINAEIKASLEKLGWEAYNAWGFLPESTLMKKNTTIVEAKTDFDYALTSYNGSHTGSTPMRYANYTRAAFFAISDYEILPIKK